MVVLDPFVGSGTTLIASGLMERRGIGIDLNPEYKLLYEERLKALKKIMQKAYLWNDCIITAGKAAVSIWIPVCL